MREHKPTMPPSTVLVLILTMLHLPLISATSLALALSPRDNEQCPDSTFSVCTFPDATFPPNFCCPASTTCMAINAFSVICCPAGQKCTAFAPVTCDITLLDAGAHPQNPIHSTNLTGTLDTCDDKCCPRGYNCEAKTCVADKPPIAINQPLNPSPPSSPSPSSSSSPSSTSPTSTPTLTAPPDAALTAPPSASPSTSPTTSCAVYPTPAILVGFFPGLLAGLALGTFLTLLLTRISRRSKISPPLEQHQNICRTDFLLRDPHSMSKPRSLSTMLLQRGRSLRSVKSVFTTSSSSAADATPPLPTQQRPPTSGSGSGRNRHKSAAPSEATSMEFVLSEAPGGSVVGMGRESQLTNFADLMENAGFKRGEGYLMASPGKGGGGKVV